MEEKFKVGLANQTFDELGNIKDLRQTFIHAGAEEKYVKKLEDLMHQMFGVYLELTSPAGKSA